MTDRNQVYRQLEQRIASLARVSGDAAGCEYCRPRIPAAVDAELDGLRGPQSGELTQHLNSCRACALEYAWLLRLAVLDEQGALAYPASVRKPDLSFLGTEDVE